MLLIRYQCYVINAVQFLYLNCFEFKYYNNNDSYIALWQYTLYFELLLPVYTTFIRSITMDNWTLILCIRHKAKGSGNRIKDSTRFPRLYIVFNRHDIKYLNINLYGMIVIKRKRLHVVNIIID
jgi:hypothetical protein